MEAKDTVTSACRLCSSATNQAKISFKAGYNMGSADMIEDLDEDSFSFLDADTVLFEMPRAKWVSLCRIAEEGRKQKQNELMAGRQEVVGWANKWKEVAEHGDYSNGVEAFGMDEGRVLTYAFIKDLEEKWQAQLKEWGISQSQVE